MSTTTRKKPFVRLNAALYAMALEELMAGPTSRSDLMRVTGLNEETISSLVKALHKRELIHIGSWERDTGGRASIAMFLFGKGRDAKKPERKTPAENKRNYMRRKAQRAALRASAGAPCGFPVGAQ